MLIVLAAAVATSVAAPLPQSAAQVAFDNATRAAEEGRCAEAVVAFDAILKGAAARRSPIVAAASAVRRGQCLIRLSRFDEAEASLRSGVPSLAAQPASFGDEAAGAYLALARVAATRLDYVGAAADTQAALALSSGLNRVAPLQMLAAFARFDGDGKAVAYSQEALDLTMAKPGVTKAELGLARTLHARSLMAADRVPEAEKVLKRALVDNGGLTTRSNLSDIATRYDLAQASLMRGKRDEARTYLAYTGAGRIGDSPFERARQMDAPNCGEVPGLTPESYAVIEFGLGEDGAIKRVEPIYAKGGREAALAYARAVQGWSWTEEAAKAIPVFYRAMTRVEIRCTRAGDRTEMMAPLDTLVAGWLEGQGIARVGDAIGDAAAVAGWRRQAAGNDATALAANLRLAVSSLVPPQESQAAAARAEALAASLGAPQPVRTRAAIAAIDASGTSRDMGKRAFAQRIVAMEGLLDHSAIAAEPVGAATIRLRLAQPSDLAGLRQAAREHLLAVADSSALPARHPLRVAALLRLANLAAKRRDLAGAEAYFQRTGLTEQQCALIGPKPAMQRSGASSTSYPQEAVRMGFEGWAMVEYDIAADGRTASQRTLFAYPPFVFGDAAQSMIANARFEPSYRPANGTACTASQTAVRFSFDR